MSINFLITFFVGIGVYLLFLLTTYFIKKYKRKKQTKQDDKENEVDHNNESKD